MCCWQYEIQIYWPFYPKLFPAFLAMQPNLWALWCRLDVSIGSCSSLAKHMEIQDAVIAWAKCIAWVSGWGLFTNVLFKLRTRVSFVRWLCYIKSHHHLNRLNGFVLHYVEQIIPHESYVHWWGHNASKRCVTSACSSTKAPESQPPARPLIPLLWFCLLEKISHAKMYIRSTRQ